MTTTLRNHSTILPGTVDATLRGAKRFRGGEKSKLAAIGKWTLDVIIPFSTAIRHSPLRLDHRFCHNSAQAVCHAISALWFDPHKCPHSVMFIKHWFSCGSKLQLPPLHNIVLTAFYVAQFWHRRWELVWHDLLDFRLHCVLQKVEGRVRAGAGFNYLASGRPNIIWSKFLKIVMSLGPITNSGFEGFWHIWAASLWTTHVSRSKSSVSWSSNCLDIRILFNSYNPRAGYRYCSWQKT